MKVDAGRVLLVCSGSLTAAMIWPGLGAAVPAVRTVRFDTVDVGRINIREPDGTRRMTIASAVQAPGFVGRGKETPAPTSAWPGCSSSTTRERRTAG